MAIPIMYKPGIESPEPWEIFNPDPALPTSLARNRIKGNILKAVFFVVLFIHGNCATCLAPRYAAIVMDANSGKVLEQEDADALRHPASLTKILTLYMVFDALKAGRIRMGTRIPVSAHAARQSPSKLGLRAGEYVTVETIVKGLVTKSANDAAAAIAEYLGGSEPAFAAMMTRKARTLGMHNSIFRNASGLPNPQQITTARDMAMLCRALYLHFPQDYRHFRLQAFHHRGKIHRNHNHLLGKVHGLDGIKTGYVAASGFNLAASAIRKTPGNGSTRLIAVVLGGPNRHWRDQRIVDLLETNFQKTEAGIPLNLDPLMRHEEDDEEESSEVALFLKEEKAKENSAKRAYRDGFGDPAAPVPVKWPLPPLPPEIPSKSLKAPARKHNLRMPGKNLWGVQVGYYRSAREARLNAQKTLARVQAGEISTPKVNKGKKTVYGARLLKISRRQAESICRSQASSAKKCRILSAK